MVYTAELRGDIPSLCKGGIDYYYTNFGIIQTIACTGRVINACIGWSDYTTEVKYKHFTIRIFQDSYSIRTGSMYTEYTETASSNYPYKLPYANKTNLVDVFNMIRSGRLSRAIIAVVLTLNQLMGSKLTGESKKAMDGLVEYIQQHYSSSIPRQPILQRVPIQNGGEFQWNESPFHMLPLQVG